MKTFCITADDRMRFMRRIRHAQPPGDTGVSGPCWIWQGRLHDGYGRVDLQGKALRAHCAAYLIFVGDIPAGKVLDHLCRVRNCVAPHHLEPVTQQENIRRGKNHVADRMRTTHCPQGHEYNEANTYRDGLNRRYCRTCRRERSRNRRRAA